MQGSGLYLADADYCLSSSVRLSYGVWRMKSYGLVETCWGLKPSHEHAHVSQAELAKHQQGINPKPPCISPSTFGFSLVHC